MATTKFELISLTDTCIHFKYTIIKSPSQRLTIERICSIADAMRMFNFDDEDSFRLWLEVQD